MLQRTLRQPVIVSAVRTPVGKFQGALSSFSATELGARVVAEVVHRAGIQPDAVDEVIMGNVVQAGLGQNPARQAALRGGLNPRVAAMTINKVCGSGLKAVALAAQNIMLGEIDIAVAGGMESMSNCPYLLPDARNGYRIGNRQVVDSMIHDGLWDVYEDVHMGITAELVAEKYKISREEQDKFALQSHLRAVQAMNSCFIESQILPIEVPQKKGDPILIKRDESPRADASLEALGKLRPAFKKDGTVTAGNAPGTNDGAAAVVADQRGDGFAPGKNSHGASGGAGRLGGRAEMGDDGAGGGGGEASAQDGMGPRPGRRSLRTERSVCRAGHRRDARIASRSGKSERKWRRRGHRASHWGFRRAHPGDAALRNAAAQCASRNRGALPGRRQRGGAGCGALSGGHQKPATPLQPRLIFPRLRSS